MTNSAPDLARINKNKFVSQSRSPKRGRVKENSVAVRKDGKVHDVKVDKFIEELKREINERK